ncbi:MAG TPA: sulfotransferase family protein [Phycisphaerales bacterium]|nr:sulfotransferase family protein [Phycisphaerales bacterium]HCD31672.1 sulfotransferase family protein [Phycisphaerales bacterium]|tara:strand:- start:11076 stop:11990 length:915 start_codon:yes stop_codon:yes gene_type:complete
MITRKLQTFMKNPVKAVQHRLQVGSIDAQRVMASRGKRICDNPIFVLGNQKSGTTIIAALLGKASNREVTLDLNYFNDNHPEDYYSVYTRTTSFRKFLEVNRIEFSNPIIKEPNLTHFYTELTKFFPLGKFLMIIRDPRDNIRSILNRFKIPGNLPELTDEHRKELIGPWPMVFDGSWCGLMGNNYIEMLAHRWVLFVQTYMAHQQEMLLCRYEDFLADKTGEIHQICQYLGMTVTHDIHNEVDVQYQSKGNRKVDWLEFFGKSNLERINTICQPAMDLMGYQLDQRGIKPEVHPRITSKLEAK